LHPLSEDQYLIVEQAKGDHQLHQGSENIFIVKKDDPGEPIPTRDRFYETPFWQIIFVD
jgi:hypothetical protein